MIDVRLFGHEIPDMVLLAYEPTVEQTRAIDKLVKETTHYLN
jgi:hypothetical protein